MPLAVAKPRRRSSISGLRFRLMGMLSNLKNTLRHPPPDLENGGNGRERTAHPARTPTGRLVRFSVAAIPPHSLLRVSHILQYLQNAVGRCNVDAAHYADFSGREPFPAATDKITESPPLPHPSGVRWQGPKGGTMSTPVAEPLERIQCQWCQSMNQKTALSCGACGAPLDIRNLVSESGWREAPAHPGHDRDPLQLQHLPGGRRNRARGRNQPLRPATPSSSNTTSCCGKRRASRSP